MEFDPLARDIAPPRHEIESDSEDESSSATGTKRVFVPPRVKLSWLLEGIPATRRDLIVFLNDSGEAFIRSQLQTWKEVGKVIIDEEQHGSLALSDDQKSIFMLLRPSIRLFSDQASLNHICLPILEDLKPSKITIIDDYNPSLCITSKDVVEDPVRYISTQVATFKAAASPSIEFFETPNYILGLAAAMMNEGGLLEIPSTVLMLPRAVNPHLQSGSRIQANSSSLDTQPDPLQEEIASHLTTLLSLKDVKMSSNKEVGQSILDFLQTRRSKARKTMAQSVSAMYV